MENAVKAEQGCQPTFLRDLDISPDGSTDSRRFEVVAEGLSLCGGCQLAMDATLVSALKGDGTHRRKADTTDGVALVEARKNKETTCPELGQGNGRVQLVVIAGEVGGRWCLAYEKVLSASSVVRGSARAAGAGDGAVFSYVPPQRRSLRRW